MKSADEINSYELPNKLDNYVNLYMTKYIEDKKLWDSILNIHPVSENIKKVPALEEFIRESFNPLSAKLI